MSTFADRRKAVVTLYPGNYQAELNDLMERALAAEREGRATGPRRAGAKAKTDADALAQEYDAKLAEAEAASVEIVLREISNMEWEELAEAHPPREDDARDAVAGFNRQAFQRALVEASIGDKAIDLDAMSRAHFMKLANAATELHGADDSLPKESLVSLLKQYRESGSKQQPDSE
jgi:hypothetical protein